MLIYRSDALCMQIDYTSRVQVGLVVSTGLGLVQCHLRTMQNMHVGSANDSYCACVHKLHAGNRRECLLNYYVARQS